MKKFKNMTLLFVVQVLCVYVLNNATTTTATTDICSYNCANSGITERSSSRVGRTLDQIEEEADKEPNCYNYPTQYVKDKHEEIGYLDERAAKKKSIERFGKVVPQHGGHHNTVWKGPTNGQWRPTINQGDMQCFTGVKLVYNYDYELKQASLMGKDCEITVRAINGHLFNDLTICKRHEKFIRRHHCATCQSLADVRSWFSDNLQGTGHPPYVLSGPVAINGFEFIDHDDETFATHERMLISFVDRGGRIYNYLNARLLFSGNTGRIYKLDLSLNNNYNQYLGGKVDNGYYLPHEPPGIGTNPYYPYFDPCAYRQFHFAADKMMC